MRGGTPSGYGVAGMLAAAVVSAAAPACSREPPGAPRAASPRALTAPAGPPAPAAADAGHEATAPAPPAAPAAPPPPAYDLAADVAARLAAGRAELGAGARTAVVDGTFVFVGPPSYPKASFDAALALSRRALAAYRNGRFARAPEEALTVVLFPNAAPYQAYCRAHYDGPCISPFGFYRHDRRALVLDAGPGLGTLTHELVHPFVATDFPGAPTWVNEGLASLYEAPVLVGPGEIRGATNWRLPRLRRARASARERDDARPSALFALDEAAFREDREDLHYALARYVCQWLESRGWLWTFYARYRDGVSQDPRGERAFREVTGLWPAEADAAFGAWLAKL